jgi:hypothetical protein
MTTVLRKPRVYKPALVTEAKMVKRPIAPCTLLPAGSPGLLLLNDANYFVEWNVGDNDAILGFRLTHCVTGQVYDLEGYDCHSCDCPDFIFRRLHKDPRGCKHMIAMRQVRGIK